MLRLIPVPLHRAGLRAAHALRKRWWRWRKPDLEAVSVLAFDLQGRLLVIRLSYGSGNWTFPTGGVDRGETPEQAARRELEEETGCQAGAMRPLGVDEGVLHGASHRVHVFATVVSGQPVADGREVVETRFFPTHSLPEPLSGATLRRLEMWRQAPAGQPD